MSGESTRNERYSDELLTAVRYLLTVGDPMKEARYGSGLQRFTAEPSETLYIVRLNAYVALENYEKPTEPVIPEDLLFIEVEGKIQQQRSSRLGSEFGKWRYSLVFAATVAGVSAGSLFWMEGILWAVMFFGGLFSLVGLPAAVITWFRLRKSKGVLRRMERILS